ncbi:MAG TPA: FmdB family zinc ribbon protein [Candidatus Limnocylindrales bacterium]|nr:FmdB family zinc ribbon protein [Candidatus Limnocylindrales bacterium]
MPIYEYVCTACDHRADILHGLNDPGPNFCPSCGKEGTMRKQFAPPAIHYKGSGWAKKDRSVKPSKAASASDDGTGKADAGDKAAKGGKAESDTTSASVTTTVADD